MTKKLINLCLVLAVMTAVFTAGIIINDRVVKPTTNENSYNSLREEITEKSGTDTAFEDSETKTEDTEQSEQSESGTTSSFDEESKSRNIKKLQEKYPDLVGWITISSLGIDYPVMQASETEDGDYYLYRSYDGSYSSYGTPYLYKNCSLNSDFQLIYGHSFYYTANKPMFTKLQTLDELDVFRNVGVVEYDTAGRSSDWEIFAVVKTTVSSSDGEVWVYYGSYFADEKEKKEYIEEAYKRSIIDTKVTATADDDILVLSSCTREFSSARVVILARRIKDGETPVGTENATLAENPKYFSAWYERYGQ